MLVDIYRKQVPMTSEVTIHKLIAVVNKNLEPGVALNAVAHMALGLSARLAKEQPSVIEDMRFLDYADKDGNSHPFISALSLIVFRATSNEIQKLRAELNNAGIVSTDFHSEMTQGTYLEQLERSRNTPEAGLEYYGLCAVGRREEIDPLTRKFSLWR